jgi:fatty acid CoA ligase FadD28
VITMVAMVVPDEGVEKLVTIIELKNAATPARMPWGRMGLVKREVTSTISKSNGLSVSDLVLVSPTTSGNVRRAECVRL